MDKDIIEAFNSIKFMKTCNSDSAKIPKDTPNLSKLFTSIINKTSLEVDQYHLQQMLSNDLNIDRTSISSQLYAVLTDALMYYIIRWPGWQRQNEYDNGNLTVEDWFSRFQQYLIFKSKYIIKSAPQQPVCEDKETQSVSPTGTEKHFAPYGLYIGAPAFVLNNIVFEERNGDILLRRCTEKVWKPLVLKELLHWPNVCVSLKLPDISISRSNVQHVVRYIGLHSDVGDPIPIDHISHIKQVPSSIDSEKFNMQPYALEFFTYYIRQLIKTLAMIPGVLASRIEEIESVLQEFLLDIDEANVYDKTMCTCISLRYHIGKFTYVRNRKMIVSKNNCISKNQNAIHYLERIVPQMDVTLHHFNAVQDIKDQDNISFVSLNRLQHRLKLGNKAKDIENLKAIVSSSCLMYSCTLCQKHMTGPYAQNDLIEHLKIEHRAEQPMLCYKCAKEFEVCTLAMNRWLHSCSIISETVS